MKVERTSPCKVNLLLNILGRRPDGFHELETIMQPVNYCDRLEFQSNGPSGIHLTCAHPLLALDESNLIHRAATRFLQTANIRGGVRIHLEKRIPLAAGLGGGSSNAAATLLGLNELFGFPLGSNQLSELAAMLGSDVPFFLQSNPALATGRGERIVPQPFFAALRGAHILLIYPGFGISTAWAYQELAKFPEARSGRSGRAQSLLALLQSGTLTDAGAAFYNALEAPALRKYPLLGMFQEFLSANGASATLMSGSGSTTFALIQSVDAAQEVAGRFRTHFGATHWIAVVPL